MKTCRSLLCLFAGLLLSTFSARANIYATDIRLNGQLTPTNSGTNVTITYRLNQAATLGVKIVILDGTTNIVTLTGGTAMGLNTVNWPATNSAGQKLTNGVFSVQITAATAGFTTWQQISLDTNPGMPAYYPLGIAVNNNSNSPYYGRVVMSCAATAGTFTEPSVPAAAQMDGLYKMNADGSQAEEGWFGNAGYLDDDAGDAEVTGQMPGTAPYNVDPMKIRIGEDDRIYWVDDSAYGAVIATDMEATTNGLVIGDNSIHTYEQSPDVGILNVGIQTFDVSETTTTNAAIWLCDADEPSWGIWMFHLTNGASDVNDPFGVQVVQTGGDLSSVSSGGCMVDTNLDIFCAQDLLQETAAYGAMMFSNWNGGVLPPPDTNSGSTAFSYVLGANPGQVAWGYGSGVGTTSASDPTFEGIQDIVINSREHPTMVACPMSAGNDNGLGGGIRVLNATNGSVITVGSAKQGVYQVLTNLDWGQAYTCAAWDNVGNLYAASTTRNLWRVWSPPGGSTNTTFSAPVILSTNVNTGPGTNTGSSTIKITGITLSGQTLTIAFTDSENDAASAYTLQSAVTLTGTYSATTGATVTGSAGTYSVSTSAPSPKTAATTEFYRIHHQ